MVRMRKRYLETPIHTYRHSNGRRVRVVGMSHDGEPRYYRALTDAVQGYAEGGAQVHYESTRTPEEDIVANATPAELEFFALRDAYDQSRLAPHPWGWVPQVVGLGPRPSNWQHRDLTLLQIVRLLGPDLMTWHLHTLGGGPAPVTERERSRVTAMRALSLYRLAMFQARNPKPTDAVLLDMRNEHALTGVEATTDDVVLMWGNSHIPGLDRGLVARGFTYENTTWHTVGRLPSMLWCIRQTAPAPRVALAALIRPRHLIAIARVAFRSPRATRPTSDLAEPAGPALSSTTAVVDPGPSDPPTGSASPQPSGPALDGTTSTSPSPSR
jgi:hypothetical protein